MSYNSTPKYDEGRAEMILARKLRLAVVTNVWRQGLITTEEARDLLRGRIVPTDPLTKYDDSALLGGKHIHGFGKEEQERSRTNIYRVHFVATVTLVACHTRRLLAQKPITHTAGNALRTGLLVLTSWKQSGCGTKPTSASNDIH